MNASRSGLTCLSEWRKKVLDYDLDHTLSSGQAFRWTRTATGAWEGVVAGRWVGITSRHGELAATVAGRCDDWLWLETYLQTGIDLGRITRSFPHDAAMQNALQSCSGLRLLRQEPWECLASFICSSTKQIVQIQQIVRHLADRFGVPVPVPIGSAPASSFPTVHRIAEATESELRLCKLGFRAPYLLDTARLLRDGVVDLAQLGTVAEADARAALMRLPGVGRKIADCVLLFAYGFARAFPVDVWITRALLELYFPRRRSVRASELVEFSSSYFGPHAGYAQQYLFHSIRTQRASAAPAKTFLAHES